MVVQINYFKMMALIGFKITTDFAINSVTELLGPSPALLPPPEYAISPAHATIQPCSP